MKHNIFKFICGACVISGFIACQNSDAVFNDYEHGTTVYFAYQYPVRTLVMGDDEYDTSKDKKHKFDIKATFGGSYNGSDGTVQVAVDNSLVDNLTFADGRPVKAMPANYYSLSTTSMAFNGTMNGATEVQLSDAFFNDPDAVKNCYVIPLVMTGQTGFGRILTGVLNEGATAVRTNEAVWDVKPMDYVLYCVKYLNKYSGYWLTNGTTNTANIEKADNVYIATKTLKSSVYTVNPVINGVSYTVDLLLTFDDNEQCTISSLTSGITASGSGSWGDDTEKKAWGNKDRDGIELNYTVTLSDGNQWSVHEKLVWLRSGVKTEEFKPIYSK